MTLALEQAGSLFTGWFRSCVSCLSSHEEVQEGERGRETKERGVEREMQVCHTQPHLVPPMKLVVYDDLPSPGGYHHRQRSSLSSWVVEGRNLASRASTHASMSWKRQSTTPLKIGTPTDFRRVDSFNLNSMPALPKQYKPLELSIHRSGHRLSDLPSFDEFQLEDNHTRKTIASPPRAFTPPGIRARRCQSSHATVSVSRKPVGSGDRLSSLHLEHIEVPEPVRIASTLIPHFSLVNPIETTIHEEDLMPFTNKSSWEANVLSLKASTLNRAETQTLSSESESEPQTPRAKFSDQSDSSTITDSPFSTRDSPSTASSRTMPSRLSSLRRPSTAENRNSIAAVPLPALPSRMSQWFFPGSKVSPSKPVSLAGENGFAWERTRTLSGTTVGSTVTTITGGANTNTRRPNFSVSSSFTASSTPRASLSGSTPTPMEKDIDAGFYHPTIFEGRSQHHLSRTDSRIEEFPRYDGSNVGVAF